MRAPFSSRTSNCAFVLVGIFAFFLTANPGILDPTNVRWLMRGDTAQHWLGWQFFRQATLPKAALNLGLNAAWVLALMITAGYFVVGGNVDSDGYGQFRMNLNAFFNSFDSGLPVRAITPEEVKRSYVVDMDTVLNFGKDGNGRKHLSGWSNLDGNDTGAWSLGRCASAGFVFGFIPQRAIDIIRTVKAFVLKGRIERQRLIVSVNGGPDQEFTAGDDSPRVIRLTVPSDAIRQNRGASRFVSASLTVFHRCAWASTILPADWATVSNRCDSNILPDNDP